MGICSKEVGIPMNKHTEVLCFMAGTGVEVHNLVGEKGPVQRRDGEGKQCDD